MEGSELRCHGSRPSIGARSFPSRIRALIYDFDDTIVETERDNDDLFRVLLHDEYGVDLSPEDQDALYGYAWTGVFDWLRVNRGFQPDRQELWARFLEVKRRFFVDHTPRIATGIHRMLELPAVHAIVSGSTREEVDMVMRAVGLRQGIFRLIICDGEYPRGKPSPDAYLMALDRLDIPPREALIFEDSLAGIRAARAAGVVVAFVGELAVRDWSAEADASFGSFTEAWTSVQERIALG